MPSPTTVPGDESERLQVYIRVRPKNEVENADRTFEPIFEELAEKSVTLVGGKTYRCDGLLDSSNQREVFERVGVPAIALAEDGFAAGIMCYGQTGTGKTFTMCNDHSVSPHMSSDSELGLIPRIASAIFRGASDALPNAGSNNGNNKGHTILKRSVSLEVVQIYRDQLEDITKGYKKKGSAEAEENTTSTNEHSEDDDAIINALVNNDKVDLRYDDKKGVELLNTTVVEVADAEEFMDVFRHAMSCRTTASTKMNAFSSRSHVAVVVRLMTTKRNEENGDEQELAGKLVLVDLAGYERFTLTDISEEKHKDEARTINSSLLALGNVIQALSSHQQHIPWRNAKLTRLMQDCVGGKSRTMVILTVGPSSEHEHSTMGTLFFGSRAMHVATSTQRDVSIDYKQRAARLQAMLDQAHQKIDSLEGERSELEKNIAETEIRMQDEIELMQANQLDQLAEMLERGEAPERIKACLASYAKELSTVLEQQQQERAFADEAVLQQTQSLLLEHSQIRSRETSILVVPSPNENTSMARSRGASLVFDVNTPGGPAGSDDVAELRAQVARLNIDLQKTTDDLENTQLELSIEKGITKDLRAKVTSLRQELEIAKTTVARSRKTSIVGAAAGISFASIDDSVGDWSPQASEMGGSIRSMSPSAKPSQTPARNHSIASERSLARDESLSTIIQRIQDEKVKKARQTITPKRLDLDSPRQLNTSANMASSPPLAATPLGTSSSGLPSRQLSGIMTTTSMAVSPAPQMPGRSVALDKLQHAQVLRRHMVELEEARSAAKIFLAFGAGWSRRLGPSLQRSLADLQQRLENVPKVLVRHELMLEETIDVKMDHLQQIINKAKSFNQPSTSAAAPDGHAHHKVTPQAQVTRPESHRLLLLSGRSVEGERRRAAGEKMPAVRSDAVLRESLSWKPHELNDYRKMLSYNAYFLGDCDAGKSSVIACMTTKAPKWIKKAPTVDRPTIKVARHMHFVPQVKLPCGEVPVGGCPGESFDIVGMMKHSHETSSCYVRLTEVPLPFLRASKPSGLPYRGTVYFLVYDIRNHVGARKRLEGYLRHVYSVCSKARAQSQQQNDPTTFHLPFVLIGTNRDGVPDFNIENDESAVLAALREQREWFTHVVNGLLSGGTGNGPQPILLDSFSVSCSAWTVLGERPRSATTFEELLHESIGYLSVHSPMAPEHLLPSPAGDAPDTKRSVSLDQFWIQHLNTIASPRAPISDTSPASAIIQRWFSNASAGVVTLFTALNRYVENAGTVIDSQTLDNLLIQHFQLTTNADTFSGGSPPPASPLQRKQSFVSGSSPGNSTFAGSVSQAFAAEPTSEELISVRDQLVDHFIAECSSRGILQKMDTAEGFAVYIIGATWFDSMLTPLLLPSALQHAAMGNGGIHANNGVRHIANLLTKTKQTMDINLDHGAIPEELKYYGIGFPSLRYLQSTFKAPVDSVSATFETTMMVLEPLNLSRKIPAKVDARRQGLLGGPLAHKNDFFVPSVCRSASHKLFNFMAFVFHAVSDSVLNGIVNVPAAPFSYFSHVCLGLAVLPTVAEMFTWANGCCFCFQSTVWVMVCANNQDDTKFHVCIGSAFHSNTIPFDSVFNTIQRVFEHEAKAYPAAAINFSFSTAEQPPQPFDQVEYNIKQLLSTCIDRNVVDKEILLVRELIERTTTPSLLELVGDVEALV